MFGLFKKKPQHKILEMENGTFEVKEKYITSLGGTCDLTIKTGIKTKEQAVDIVKSRTIKRVLDQQESEE